MYSKGFDRDKAEQLLKELQNLTTSQIIKKWVSILQVVALDLKNPKSREDIRIVTNIFNSLSDPNLFLQIDDPKKLANISELAALNKY